MSKPVTPEVDLARWRACLIGASERLSRFRRLGCLNSNDRHLLSLAEQDYCHALDGVWAAQIAVSA